MHTSDWPIVEEHAAYTVRGRPAGPPGAGRIHMTPEQLKSAALRLVNRTFPAADSYSRDAAMVAHAYLVSIGALPDD